MDSTARASDKGSSWESDGSAQAPVRDGDVVSEKYVCEGVIGVGGMGVVVTARDRLLERKVAIKFLLPRFVSSEIAVQRFIREARAATRITSEHVVKLLEIDRLPSGVPFLVMEYLEGRDLKAVLTDTGPLTPRQAVDYVLQAAQAVAEGHLKGIIHRDLKPSNLFVAQRADGTPLIKVLDFGIAKTFEQEAFDAGLTSSDDTRLGTPAYMPPEQLQSPRDVDARSDIWGLGVTLYELLSNALPFSGSTFADLVLQITRGQPDQLAKQLERGLPGGLEAVILRCLEKDRDLRYPNVLEFATALAPFGGEEAAVSLRRVRGLKHSTPVGAQDAAGGPLTPATTTLLAEVGAPPPVSRRRVRVRPVVLTASALSVLALVVWIVLPSQSASNDSPLAGDSTEGLVQPSAIGSATSMLGEDAKLADGRALAGTLGGELDQPVPAVSPLASAPPKPPVRNRALMVTSPPPHGAPPSSASAEAKPPPVARSIEALIETRR